MNTHSRLFKVTVHTLISVMCLHPLFSLAAGVRVDASAGGHTYMTQAGNGVPMVIIAKPNEKGLSHNKFIDYNVDQQGLILNNSTEKFTQTLLSGTIIGNGYLQGQPAQLILNEVNGGQASQLKGYTEVAGHQAHVVVANPHGITCDGCGFINTPHVTLASGQPVIEQGQLSRYDVVGGQIEIAGAGLNATNISQFDLITRSAKINAELHANQLNIVTGNNSVDAQNLVATAKTGGPADQPHFAIDSSALGGMYAGAIRLIGTETGVGVNLAGDMASSAGDIKIDTRGKLTLARVSAAQQLKVNAQEVDLTQQVYAGDQVKVQADKLTNKDNLFAANGIDLTVEQVDNHGLIEAGLRADNTLNSTADIRIKGTTLSNSGSVIASHHLQIDSKERVSNKAAYLVADAGLTVRTQQLDNQQGLITATGTVEVSAQHIDNRNQGELSSQQQLMVNTEILDNRESGRVISEADLSIVTQGLDNSQSGIVVADKSLTVRATHLDNSAQGVIKGTQTLAITADSLNNHGGGRVLSGTDLYFDVQRLNNSDGVLDAQGLLSINAHFIDNMRGQIVGNSGVRINSDSLDNRADGLLLSHGVLEATVSQFNNQQGTVIADAGVTLQGHTLNNDAGRIASPNNVRLGLAQLNNTQGVIAAGHELTVTAQTIDNANGELSAGRALTLGTQLLQQNQGQILSAGEMNLTAQVLDNSGQGLISAGTALNIQAERLDNQQLGTVISDGVLNIETKQLNNYDQGLLLSKGLLHAQLNQLDQHHKGEMISSEAIYLNLSDGHLNNSQGGLIYAPQLQLQQIGLLNNSQGGEISTPNDLVLNAQQLNNAGGLISSGHTLQLRVEGIIDNTLQGLLSAGHDLQVSGATLNNSQKGTLVAKGDLLLQVNKQLDNSQEGAILADGQLQIATAALNNSKSGVIVSNEQLNIYAKQVDNQQEGLLSGLAGLHVSADSLQNQHNGTLSSQAGELTVQIAGSINNNQQGAFVSQQSLKVQAGRLDNQQGIVSSESGVELQVAGDIDNQQGQISALDVTLDADNLFNSAGQISAENTLAITLTKELLNQQSASIISGQELLLTANTVNNHNSVIAGEGLLSVFAQHLHNQQGAIIAATDQLQLHAQHIDNQSAIYSHSSGVAVQADTLSNSKGLIQARDELDLEIKQQLVNHNGRIISEQGALSVQAQTIDNQEGVFASLLDQLTLSVRGLVNNQAGTVQGQDVVVDAHEVANQGGGIYAQQQLIVSGHNLDNSAQGQIAANTIDFSLTGALNNQSGIVEADHLYVTAHSVSNKQGRLRMLASTGDSVIRTESTFDNRNGSIETSNTNFALDAPNLLNQSGSVAHAGSGQFDVMSGHADNVGGTLASQGTLLVTSDSWENSTVFQAGALTLNVGQFTQTASGQLIAHHSLTATGDTWINDGLIASDGDLSLQLTGNYSGNGQVTSLGTMQLSANQFTLGEQAVIYSDAAGRLDSQQLTNQGHISAAGTLVINTQALNNQGSLGSAQQLSISTPYLSNDNGLIFSGADMVLRVEQLSNRYADIYSLGSIDLAGYVNNNQAQRVENVSGSIEAAHDFSLYSAVVENRRDILDVENTGKYSVVINELACRGPYNPYGDCKQGSNGRRVGVWEITEREKLDVVNSSAASNLLAGGTLSFSGDSLLNSSSLISSGGDLNLSFNEVSNIGVKPADIEAKRIFVSGRKPNYYTYLFLANQFNAMHGAGVQKSSVEEDLSHFIGRMEGEYLAGRELIEIPLAGEEYSAIIQAGGNLTINAQQTLENSVIRPNYSYVSGGTREDNGTPGGNYATDVSINSQLPADVQQKQIDPTVLPSFNLPTGDKGLFRLSGQSVQEIQTQAAGDANSTASKGSARDGQLTPQGSSFFEQHIVLSSQLIGSSTTDDSYERSQVEVVPSSLQNVQGQNNGHHYLVETNPALTSINQFLSSDHLLDGLGLSADHVQKRLGDGLYEQKLMREALVARTGQRFIAGIDNDEAMYRYLMDNAIASKEALQLSVGVSLNAEQVAALTHDIVWLEEREVLGEKVLTPVLYMAQADGRLAPNGALIQGRNLALISGGDLSNQGTLGAIHNLTAQAQSISNVGLIEASERLSLQSEDSLYNRQGGILAGRDVDLTARTGDIVNERTVTRHDSVLGSSRWESSFTDSAARIEATGNLALSAGRDVQNLGGVLDSRADLEISAGRDVTLASVEERHSTSRGNHYLNAQSQQQSSETLAGANLRIHAGQDLTAVASRIESGADMQLIAGNDLALASASNEQHFYSESKKVTSQNDQVRQVGSEVQAASDLLLHADNDLNIIGTRVQAANDIAISAEQDVYILSAQDESASFYSKDSKKSFGRSKSTQQESYDSTNVASVIDAGHNLTINTRITDHGGLSLNGGRDVTVIGSQLNAGNHVLVGTTNSINVLSGVEEHGSYSKKTKSGFAGLSQTGKSQLETTATQVGSELNAANDVILVAGNDLSLRASHIDAGHDIELHAGLLEATGDINLLAANNEAYSLTERYRKKIDLSASDGMVSFSSAKKSGRAAQSSTSVGSQVTAEHDTHLQAERDINIVGSGVSAGGRLLLDAGRDVQVSAANNHKATSTWQSERRTGIALSSDRNGVSAFAGNETNINNDWESQSTATASQLEAGGDLAIQSGRDISQTGSDLIAGQDIHLIAERNIILDAASEKQRQQQEKTRKRTGLTVNISHNFESTQDAIRGAGRGDNALSKVSGVLRANDSITQFVSGPTTSEHLGASRQDTTTVEDIHSYRESTLGAGRDINLQAGLDVEARATLISSQRDINVTGQNITLDVARGHYINSAEQALSKAGINGSSTSNSARVGIGGSHSIQKENGRQSTALPTQLQAGRDINLEAKQDLTLLGTQVQAQRDIQLSAGQDLSIHAVQNDSSFATQRTSGGGELGLAVGGAGMLSVYASADIGKGNLDREGINQQQAYLYAGHHLKLNSGRDTIIAGAQLEGEHVTGRIGRDLLMSSVPDTGKVSGKEFDASMTGSVGLTDGVSASGSVGVGQTTGSTDWIESQTQIIAHDALDIRTENHTQLDSALIASHTGNLKLDTNTLGFTDFEGHDKERSWYVNAGGSYTWAGDNGKSTNNEAGNDKTADKAAVVDHSQKNKEGSNSWDVSGYSREKDREQIVRATVGEGEIIVRSDAETGFNSIHDLNRDTNKAYEITKDKDETTELYVSSSSLDSASNPKMTFEQWKQGFNDYGLNSAKAFLQLGLLKDNAATEAEKNNLVAALAWAPSLLVDAMDVLNKPTVGVFPGVENHGGLVTQVPALAVGDLMLYRVKGRLKLDEYGELVIEEGKPVLDGKPMFDSFDEFKEGESAHISTNGIMNNLLEAITNALMQGGMPDGKDFILAYNPTHGLLGDLIESAFDSLFQGSIKSGTARNLDNLYQQASHSPISSLHIYGHSQGGLLTWVAVQGQDFSNINLVTVQVSGAPIDAVKFHKDVEETKKENIHSYYQVNRPDETTSFGLPKTDAVADLLGGNAKYSSNSTELILGAVFSFTSLFDAEKSAHSNYSCASCDVTGLTKAGGKIREFVINPTLIDKEGKTRMLNK